MIAEYASSNIQCIHQLLKKKRKLKDVASLSVKFDLATLINLHLNENFNSHDFNMQI